MNPLNRYVDICLRFKIKDGENAGRLTRPYGGIFDTKADRGLGKYVSYYDPAIKGFTGKEPKTIVIKEISNQQLPFVTDYFHKLILALGGRRSGKTAALGARLAILMIVFPGVQGVILSPTYRQAKNSWRSIRRIIPRKWIKYERKIEMKMVLINNASIVLLSGDNEDSSRSEGAGFGAIDERGLITDEAFSNAFFSQSEGNGFSSIGETATIIPQLREHYEKVKKSKNAIVYRMGSYDNPFINTDFLKLAEEFIDSEKIKRELYAEWPEAKGRCYPCFNKELHVIPYPIEEREDITGLYCNQKFNTPNPQFGNDSVQYIIGIDPPTNSVVARLYDDGTVHFIDEIIVNEDGKGGDIRELANTLWARYKPSVIVSDPNDFGYLKDLKKYLTRQSFYKVRVRKYSIEDRLTAVRARIEKGKLFVDPKCKRLIECFSEHKYSKNDINSGKPEKYQKFKDSNLTMDHIGDAAGYLITKLFPAKINLEKMEKEMKKAS